MEGVSRGRLALRAACLLLVLGVSAPGAEAGDPEKAPPVLVLQADPVRTPGGTLPSLVVSQDGAVWVMHRDQDGARAECYPCVMDA